MDDGYPHLHTIHCYGSIVEALFRRAMWAGSHRCYLFSLLGFLPLVTVSLTRELVVSPPTSPPPCSPIPTCQGVRMAWDARGQSPTVFAPGCLLAKIRGGGE